MFGAPHRRKSQGDGASERRALGPDVFEVAVIGVPSEECGESVHAVVVPAHPGVTEADVVAFARQHLAGYETPRSVSFVDELPKTGSGKVLKRELRAPFWADPGAGHHVTPGQIALAWLLSHGPNLVVIPGTTSIAHLEENIGAGAIKLIDDDIAKLTAMG